MRPAVLPLLGALALAHPASAQRPELLTQTELRVCADPHNLPFSNDQKAGFENKVAAIIAADLQLPVSYVWFPQTVGFVRNTLRTRACDLVMGAVAGDAEMDTTNPYYRAGYMLVTRDTDESTAHAVDDPALADKRFGYIAATPPTDLLLKHHLLDHATSYALTVDTRVENPARQMLQDLLDDKIDVALVWGPIVQYAIAHDHLKLKAVMLDAEPDAPRLDYAIAMGVRANEPEWRR
ncbi:MAG: quinoprotein dehydrogenase-associated putative ABC transporter substrate-binding protein, partial [Alphaproteobacteria bacterium]